jgi:hypothetical protein
MKCKYCFRHYVRTWYAAVLIPVEVHVVHDSIIRSIREILRTMVGGWKRSSTYSQCITGLLFFPSSGVHGANMIGPLSSNCSSVSNFPYLDGTDRLVP